ncbi:MAG: hypothetical protein JWO45_646, partial [Spartobacteria bacterium]|nr:hypothetical protein [Spartobacteria bacterium]
RARAERAPVTAAGVGTDLATEFSIADGNAIVNHKP